MREEEYTTNVLEFSNISTSYGARTVLNEVNFSIKKGEFCYLIGHTGAGKSSILKLIYADLKPKTGNLKVGNFDVANIKRKEIPFLRRKLGIVFQDFQLLPDRNIHENIKFAMKATGWKDKTRINNKISELLARVGLATKAQSLPHQLSGGEQQRVVIARSLINDPILLLADEPTGNLDPVATDMIMEILFKINLAGTSIIMATHEHDLIRKYPARTLECIAGEIVDHKHGFE